MVRPTHLQMEMLLRFLEENPGIAKGYMRTSQAKHETKIKWDRIAVELNSIGGAIKDGKAWAKVWTDKKYTLKKIIARRYFFWRLFFLMCYCSARHTGGGVDIVPPLTELDEKLLGILGGTSFALGNSDVSVPLSVPIEHKEGPQEDAFIQEPQVNAHAQEIQSSPTRSPRRRRTQRLEKEKERLVRIEEKRVEAELKAAAGWESVAGGLQSLADSIRVAGEKTEKGLQAIADAIMTAAAAKNS